jgi:hypothetical protein
MSTYLVMELGGTVLYRESICYDGLLTAGEKMHLQERMAREMRQRYAREERRSGHRAKFYVSGELSQGNRKSTDEVNEGADQEAPPKDKRA